MKASKSKGTTPLSIMGDTKGENNNVLSFPKNQIATRGNLF